MAWGGGKGSPIFFACVDFFLLSPNADPGPRLFDYEKYSTLLANINRRLYTVHPLAV